jgi:ribosome modulation factor
MHEPTPQQVKIAREHGYEAGVKNRLRSPPTYWNHPLTEAAWLEGYAEGESERADEP